MGKRKKVGIVTFHRACNYGAVLQAYALKVVLKKLHPRKEVHLVDYIMSSNRKMYSPFYIRGNHESAKPMYNIFRYIRFQIFIHNKLDLFCPILSYEDLKEEMRQVDIGVWGSDQVWNPQMYDKEDEAVYLGRVECKKKIAYAVSIGNSKEKQLHKYVHDIKSYDSITLRDIYSLTTIQNITGRDDMTIMLDPTLLLSKKIWKNMLRIPKIDTEKYMLYYEVNSSNAYDIAKKLAQKFGLRLKVISYQKRYSDKNVVNCIEAGPIEFLSLFYNAEVVCTSSFHGVAFSVNFEKPFFCVDNDFKNGDTRKHDFLRNCNLLNRVITMQDLCNIDNYEVDFGDARAYIREQRKKSISFLRKAIDV